MDIKQKALNYCNAVGVVYDNGDIELSPEHVIGLVEYIIDEIEDDGSHKDIEEYQKEREIDQIERHHYPAEG